MKTALLIALALAGLALAPAADARPGPCPDHCTPPEPCGWPPNPAADPQAYAWFWVGCVSGQVAWPHGPVLP